MGTDGPDSASIMDEPTRFTRLLCASNVAVARCVQAANDWIICDDDAEERKADLLSRLQAEMEALDARSQELFDYRDEWEAVLHSRAEAAGEDWEDAPGDTSTGAPVGTDEVADGDVTADDLLRVLCALNVSVAEAVEAANTWDEWDEDDPTQDLSAIFLRFGDALHAMDARHEAYLDLLAMLSEETAVH